MKKQLLTLLFFLSFHYTHAQVAICQYFGKNASDHKLGFETFAYFSIPIDKESYTKSVVIELLDVAFLPTKNPEPVGETIGYLSIKAGYKKVFSDTRTGFFIEPQFGYADVINYATQGGDTRSGVAVAMIGGYNLGVGQKFNSLQFDLKYEEDIAGANYTVGTLGLRTSFAFD